MLNPTEVLKQYWGFDQFREKQDEIIRAVLSGKDTLALLPTGGGKSICFQVPTLCKSGLCIVVTPLIALMKDQVQNLHKRNITAAAIYSGMSYTQIDRVLENALQGAYSFIYVSPERLETELFQGRVKQMNVSLIAIDEAHCISQWGYDFRPSYLRIAALRELIGTQIPVIALTATATPRVVDDIQEKLLFKEKNVISKSFVRSNLAYVVRREEAKLSKLVEIMHKVSGSAVVYVRNRRKTREIAEHLYKNKINADFYHAGIEMQLREKKQADWSMGKTRVMVCTNAFGMGIDKPDVRIVAHMDLPESIEAYFQEAGRAGRDEKKAFAVLLYEKADSIDLISQFERACPNKTAVTAVYNALFNYLKLAVGSGKGEYFELNLEEIAEANKLDVISMYHALKILEEEGYLIFHENDFSPSYIQLTANREEIYRLKVEHQPLENLLDLLSRSYEGIFDDLVPIKEFQLAKRLRKTESELINMLAYLQQMEAVDYRPNHGKPKIYFVHERLDEQNLLINWERVEKLREIKREQIKQMISYAETEKQCRSRFLTAYFGEKNSENCGVCDYCVETKKHEIETAHFAIMAENVKEIVGKNRFHLNELLLQLNQYKKQEIVEVLEWMIDSNELKKNDKGEFWISETEE